ncbi:hypothetical protein PGTUg99_010354 [Puccinia graminis f. sp. tritici]|uniref:Uncharacterized protein n=1 Tax=Puccinia graminis f. sp. tritici TaxID=56615 RepID=A0A5B0M1B9_PUCGR|nr:hypothetical protein PGTUg99_010354 [Puccinia graminis f. sp. tritici]
MIDSFGMLQLFILLGLINCFKCDALEHSPYSLESLLGHQSSEDHPESGHEIFQETFASAQVPILSSDHQFPKGPPLTMTTIPSNSESQSLITEKTQFEVGRSLYCDSSAGLKQNIEDLPLPNHRRAIGLTDHDHPQYYDQVWLDHEQAPSLTRFSENLLPENPPRSSQHTSSSSPPLSQVDWENYVFHILHEIEEQESVNHNSNGNQFAGYYRTQSEGVINDQSSRSTQPPVTCIPTIPDHGPIQPPAMIENPRLSTSHLPNHRGIMVQENNELGYRESLIPGSNGLSNPNGAFIGSVQNRKETRIPMTVTNINGHSASPEPMSQNGLLEPSDLGSLLRGLEQGLVEVLGQNRRHNNINKSHSKSSDHPTLHPSLAGKTPTLGMHQSSPTGPNYSNLPATATPSDTSNPEIPVNFSYQALLHSELPPIQLSPTNTPPPFYPEHPNSGRFNHHPFFKDSGKSYMRVANLGPLHPPETHSNRGGPLNQQSGEILSEETWVDFDRVSPIPTNHNNNKSKAQGLITRPTGDDKHSTAEPPRFLGRGSTSSPTDRDDQRSKIFRFDAQVFRFGSAEGMAQTDHHEGFYQEFIDEIQATPSKELVILDCPSIKRYRNLIKQIVHSQALLAEDHSLLNPKRQKLDDERGAERTKRVKKMRLAERRSMLTEATNLVFKNRRLWYKFWGERTGIHFETVEVLHKAGYSQKLVENEFVLFIFYVDMIATIIPVYDSERITDPAQRALLRDYYSARLLENALNRYRLLGIVQVHLGELHTYVRPKSKKPRIRKKSLSSTRRHHHPSKTTTTKSSNSINYLDDHDDEDDPDYKKFCGRDLLAKLWLSLAGFIKSLPAEYQILRDILLEERHPYVSHYPKMFFNDLFSYSILILNQRLKSYYNSRS